MKTKQAKDFLTLQTAEQAARENIPLSDIEKKMMYFTESNGTSCDNPVELNDEFEAQYETAVYEAKISRLLHHAYNRLKAEDPDRNFAHRFLAGISPKHEEGCRISCKFTRYSFRYSAQMSFLDSAASD